MCAIFPQFWQYFGKLDKLCNFCVFFIAAWKYFGQNISDLDQIFSRDQPFCHILSFSTEISAFPTSNFPQFSHNFINVVFRHPAGLNPGQVHLRLKIHLLLGCLLLSLP